MDQQRFEELSRRVGTAATRRGALKVLAGGVGGLRPSPCSDPGAARRMWTFGISPTTFRSCTAG